MAIVKANHIVLMRVRSNTNARKLCEHIENTTYEDIIEFRKSMGNKEGIEVYTMSTFMDMVNSQELDNLSNYFISYIRLNKINLVDN